MNTEKGTEKAQNYCTKNGHNLQLFLSDKIYFYIRNNKKETPTNIYFSVSVCGKKLRLSAHVKVYPSQWENKRQKAVVSNLFCQLDNSNNQIVNERIEQITAKYKDIVISAKEEENPKDFVLTQIFATFVQSNKKSNHMKRNKEKLTKKLKELNISDIGAKQRTKINRENSIALLESFFMEKNISDSYDSITFQNWTLFKDFLLKKKNKRNQSYTISTLKENLARLLTLFNLYNKTTNERIDIQYLDKKLTHTKLNKEQKESKEYIFKLDQLKEIYKIQLPNKTMQKAKDFYVFFCLTGCRISDMEKILKGKYTEEQRKGILYLDYDTEKNNIKAHAPIKYPESIDMYNRIKNGEFKHTNIKSLMNNYLKIAFKEFFYETQTKTTLTSNGITEEKKYVWQLLHPHGGRHNFVSMMCNEEHIDKNLVKEMTGHTDDTMIENVYWHKENEDILNSISDSFNKTKETENVFETNVLEAIEEVIEDLSELIINSNKPNPIQKIIEDMKPKNISTEILFNRELKK